MNSTPSRSPAHRPDRGEAIVEHVILVPIVLLIVLLGVQAAVYFHAANVAEHASSRAVSVASRYRATNATGLAEATATVRDSGSVVAVASVTGGTTIRASVTVRVNRILPFFPSTVTREASEPKERFIPEGER